METPYQYYLNGLPMAMLLLSGLAALVSFALLCSAWSSTSYKLQYGLGTIVVKKFRTQTQRKRYVKIASAAAIGAVMTAILVYVEASLRPYSLYYGLDAVRDQRPAFGLFLTACQMASAFMAAIAILVLLRVQSKPSIFRKQIMFGENKGQYVFGIAVPRSDYGYVPYFYDKAPTDLVDR